MRQLNIFVLCFILYLVSECCLIHDILYAQQKKRVYHDLFSVTFPNENDGWVCGRWGTILHSTDGGERWTFQDSSTDYSLSSIFFIDSQNGWAVGDGGCIVLTHDGGVTWSKQESPVPYSLMGVHFINASRGWIATEKNTILYSDNGGKSWQVQFRDEDFILKKISFCDEHTGWAAGEYGYIYHTENGGLSWQRQAGEFGFSPETGEVIGGNFLFDMFVVNPMTAWVVGIDGYIAVTFDGGVSWQNRTAGIVKSHLFAITTDGGETVIIGGKSALMTSLNGGKTFTECEVDPAITYGWIYDVARKGNNGYVAVGKEGWIYITDKEAMHWRRVKY